MENEVGAGFPSAPRNAEVGRSASRQAQRRLQLGFGVPKSPEELRVTGDPSLRSICPASWAFLHLSLLLVPKQTVWWDEIFTHRGLGVTHPCGGSGRAGVKPHALVLAKPPISLSIIFILEPGTVPAH